jgi:Rap1a immunity proteins
MRAAMTIFITCCLSWGAAEAAETGGTLLNECKRTSVYSKGYCMGFLRAVWQMSEKGCGPSGIPWGEVVGLYVRYANDKPEWWTLPAEEAVEAAIEKAFPCKRNAPDAK